MICILVLLGLGYNLWGFRIIKLFVIFGGMVLVVMLVVFILVKMCLIFGICLILFFKDFWSVIVWDSDVFGICSVCMVILFLFKLGVNLLFNLVVW